jgi:hypothetical protein
MQRLAQPSKRHSGLRSPGAGVHAIVVGTCLIAVVFHAVPLLAAGPPPAPKATPVPPSDEKDYGFSMLGAEQVKCGGEKSFMYFLVEGSTVVMVGISKNKVLVSDTVSVTFPNRKKLKKYIEDKCNEGFGAKKMPGGPAKVAVDPESHSVGSFPLGSVGGDFDDDGVVDLAVVNQNSSNVSILMGIPGGSTTGSDPSFADAVNYPTGPVPLAIRAGDLDEGDGTDLLTVNLNNYVNGTLSLLVSNGDGSFQAPVTLTAGTLPSDAAVGYLDDDGHLDIAAADTNQQRLVLLFGNGDGTFQTPVNLATPGYPTAVVAADLDLDLDVDLVTDESILLNNGDGTFAAAVAYPGVFQPYTLAVGDLDEDEVPDIVTANISSNTVSVYLGDGNGGVDELAHYVVGDGAEHIEVVDFDGDGHLDVVVSNYSSDHASLLYGTGDGRLEGAPAFPAATTTTSFVSGLAVAHLNDDAHPDVVVGRSSSAASILPGTADTWFGEPVLLNGQTCSNVVAGRFDDDALDDLVFVPSSGGVDLQVRLRTGDFSFAAATPVNLPGAGGTAGALLSDDIDHDTFPDLATANSGEGGVSVLIGDGAGGFAPQPVFATGTGPAGVASGLLDDDDLPDLAVANAGNFAALDGSVSVLLSNDPQGFNAPVELFPNTTPDSVAIADFNRDGHGDLAVSLEYSQFNWGIRVLLGDGSGGFGAPAVVEVPTSFQVEGVQAVDIDGDRNPDLIARLGGPEIAIMLGRGDGTFEPGVTIDDGDGGADIIAADIDADGLLDLLSTISQDGGVALLLNRSSLFVDGFESGDTTVWSTSTP